jgi:hypothetical protein
VASSRDVCDTLSSYTGATTSEKRRTTYYAPSDCSHASRASSSSKPYTLYAFGQGAAGVGVGYGGMQKDDVAVIGRKRMLSYSGHNHAGAKRTLSPPFPPFFIHSSDQSCCCSSTTNVSMCSYIISLLPISRLATTCSNPLC